MTLDLDTHMREVMLAHYRRGEKSPPVAKLWCYHVDLWCSNHHLPTS